MSKLVQQWEQSYIFTEDELGFLAESQKALSQPIQFNKDASSSQANPVQSTEGSAGNWIAKEVQLAVSLLTTPPAISKGTTDLLAVLAGRVSTARQLEARLMDLQGRIAELQGSHEAVKSKSLVMQSLWDGLVAKQMEYSSALGQIRKTMTPYLDYEKLYKAVMNVTDVLSPTFLQALPSCSQHYRDLQAATGHIDAPLYAQRYHGLVSHGIKSLQQAIMAELDTVTKQSSIRLRTPTLQVLADVNAEFLLSAAKLSASVQTLNECTEPHKEYLDRCFVEIMSQVSSLLHYFFSNYDASETDPLGPLIALTHHALGEERILAERLLGPTFRSFSLQYRKTIETVMVPVLRRIRTIYAETPVGMHAAVSTLCVQAMAQLRPGNEEQRRILQVLQEFFSPVL